MPGEADDVLPRHPGGVPNGGATEADAYHGGGRATQEVPSSGSPTAQCELLVAAAMDGFTAAACGGSHGKKVFTARWSACACGFE